MKAREWGLWIALTLLVAAAVHLATVWYLPHAIMRVALSRMGAMNAIHFQNRPDEHSRGVVRPSPDLLYSACPFDLSKGPLRVRAPVPNDTYWSVSAFDADTDNFFARNDRQADGVVDFLIVDPSYRGPIEGLKAISSPSKRGLVLFRVLIDDEKDLAAIDDLRRQAQCSTFRPAAGDLSNRGGR